MIRLSLLSIVLVLSLSSCYYDKGDKLYPNVVECDTLKMTYASIKPILQSNCIDKGCHTTSANFGGVILENYSGTKASVTGEKLINALKYISGGTKNMPPTGKLSDCEINKVEAWIRRGTPEF